MNMNVSLYCAVQKCMQTNSCPVKNANNFLQVSPEWDFRRALLFQGLYFGFINISELKTELAKNNSIPSIICLLTKEGGRGQLLLESETQRSVC